MKNYFPLNNKKLKRKVMVFETISITKSVICVVAVFVLIGVVGMILLF